MRWRVFRFLLLTATATIALQEQLIQKDIQPQATMDLILGRPRLLQLREAPFRIQVADDKILNYTIIGSNPPRQLSLQTPIACVPVRSTKKLYRAG